MMKAFSSSKKLISSVKNFINISYFYPFFSRFFLDEKTIFYGWGRKKSAFKALSLAKKYQKKAVFLEDGFLRSLGLGLENAPSFSLVEDDLGIYYDATCASKLEKIILEIDLSKDESLKNKAQRAINLIKELEISKYNDNLNLPQDFFKKTDKKRILIIAQTSNDLSLKYSYAQNFSTQHLINDALKEQGAEIYLKIHPDILTGKKKADFDIKSLPENVRVISQNYNPIALLKHFDKVYTKSSGMGFEALICGCECVCYGLPFYAGWGLTKDKLKCKRRNVQKSLEEVFAAAYLLYTRYFNPYEARACDIFSTIYTLFKQREIARVNSGRCFFYNFTLWKRGFIKPFFKAKNNQIIFLNSFKDCAKYEFSASDKLFVWGGLIEDELLRAHFGADIKIYRVEDGFVRSLGLGSDFTKPCSIVVDSKALFIDPRRASDLEDILNFTHFDESLLKRAKEAIKLLRENKISKYNTSAHKSLKIGAKVGQKVILIPAQVEDDASMILAGFNFSTLDLIKEVRAKNKDAYILFKIHPDVISGNRKGLKDRALILEYCDEIIEQASIYSCFEVCDEVHTITSTTGFEALLNDIEVFTYGLPFYAGWNLTSDRLKCERRKRHLSLEELAAGTLLIYPRYLDIKSENLCEFKKAFDTILVLQKAYFSKFWLRMALNLRNFLLRKARRSYEKIYEKFKNFN